MSKVQIRNRSAVVRRLGSSAIVLLALASTTQTAVAQAVVPAQAQTPASAIPVLSRAQIDALLATPDKVVFLDVRRADEIETIGGFPVFLNIQNSELDRFLGFIPRDRQIVTISNHAHRGQAAGELLKAKGFTVAGAVGVQDYEEQGGTLYGRKVVTPAIDGVVKAGTRVEVVREGFDGTEGPVGLPDGSILFTENRADRIVQVGADGKISTFAEKTGSANALAITGKGEILAVQTAPSAIAAIKPTPKVWAANFGGKPFNRLNDLAFARAGDVYFTDPGAAPTSAAESPRTGLYWLDRKGKVSLVADDIRRPNGVALSPDEKTLYVANTGGEYVIAYTVRPDGSLTDRRNFAKLAGFKESPTGPTSGADGLVVDSAGRLYVASLPGIQVFGSDGAALGIIPLPKQPQNLAFGGKDRSALYAVGRGSVYRIATQTRGVDRPGK
ncbi:MAG: SMP-30/gluconolactonase/LRE family protein [Sphingobium sp.]|nr:SMP-30/gluconolactonase/LRE family protein [Sphingobium sp.]